VVDGKVKGRNSPVSKGAKKVTQRDLEGGKRALVFQDEKLKRRGKQSM